MMRQRNIRSNKNAGEGIFIWDVDVEEQEKSSNIKRSGQSEGGCWKHFAVGITFVTGKNVGYVHFIDTNTSF